MAGWRDGWEGTKGYLREVAESQVGERIGVTMVEKEELQALREAAADLRATRRELDMIGWHVLDYMSGNPHEVKPKKRKEAAQQARLAWMYDPMAGRAVELMNDFVFGRGVPPPRAREPEVQKILDAAWKDPDNVAVLTGFMAQAALGTDLTLQSNLFVLFFDDGEDGKVKLSLLDHDTVFDAVRDPENRLRVLYYVATHTESEWDFEHNQLKTPDLTADPNENVRYYAHWKNVEDAERDAKAGLRDAPPKPPKERMGEGKVYHITVNRTTEMVFGVPKFQRTLRWFSAYNNLMSARVDMAQAAAELIMKKKVKGGPAALQKMAAGAIARGGEIATGPPSDTRIGSRPASTIVENENVTNEAFKLDSGAANAVQDATMIRSQVSAGLGLPQHYLGDQGNANLATATAMDLPVTKMVESVQELFEQLFRAFCDLSLRRAVEKGLLKGELPDDEAEAIDPSRIGEAGVTTGTNAQEDTADGIETDAASPPVAKPKSQTAKAKATSKKKLDLSYEFKMPNPLRRLMGDLVSAIMNIAKTFDPNGTNMELSRTLLTIALGEALEMQDPSDAVERIFPEGYQDPLVAAELAGQAAGAVPPETPAGQPDNPADYSDPTTPGGAGPTPAAGGEPGSGRQGPYGTKSKGTLPEEMQQADFDEIVRRATELAETRYADMKHGDKADSEDRVLGMADEFDAIVGAVADQVLDQMPALAASNGHVGS